MNRQIGEILDNYDPRCPNCDIPLRAVMRVTDGRCADTEACNARRSAGPGHLISPSGVTPFGNRKGVT